MQKKDKILAHFQTEDPVIFHQLSLMKWEVLEPLADSELYFSRLCRDIIAQQLSGKAADSILARFQALMPNQAANATSIMALTDEELRTVGLSWAKVKYIKDLAARTLSGELEYGLFLTQDETAVIEQITKVKGIGQWTAEMFLIFTLGRENIFSFGDLGLRNGLKKLYGNGEVLPPEIANGIVSRWSPYKSYASLAVWHSLDNR